MGAVNECSARPLYRAPVSAIIPPPIHAAPLLLETARARSIERQPFLLNFFPCFPARFRKRRSLELVGMIHSSMRFVKFYYRFSLVFPRNISRIRERPPEIEITTEKLNSSGLFDLEFRVFAYSLATTQRQFTSVSRGWKLAITNA